MAPPPLTSQTVHQRLGTLERQQREIGAGVDQLRAIFGLNGARSVDAPEVQLATEAMTGLIRDQRVKQARRLLVQDAVRRLHLRVAWKVIGGAGTLLGLLYAVGHLKPGW